ncbi:MAG: DUF2793 domain-containing protein [Pseudomonadota bacterium]
MVEISNSLSLPFIQPSQAQKHVTHNEALRILDVVTQLGVVTDDLTAPPGSVNEGARYLVDTGATGDWAGHDGEIALYETSTWRFFVPRAGWRAFVINREAFIVYDGAEWIDLDGPELEEIDSIGLGMASLPGAPFSAKLNAALWTALYTADGGSGNMMMTLNKEAMANDAGFVLQQDFQTRALLGLFGSDRLRLSTSPDGTTFFDGFSIDNATGIVDQPQLPRFKGVTNFDNFGAANTWTKIAINQLSYNDQSVFDAASNVFNATVDGTYLFGALLTFKADSSTAARLGGRLVVNGGTTIAGSQSEVTGAHVSERTTTQLQTLVSLQAGDTVELQGIMRSQSGFFMADRTDFWGFKVG